MEKTMLNMGLGCICTGNGTLDTDNIIEAKHPNTVSN